MELELPMCIEKTINILMLDKEQRLLVVTKRYFLPKSIQIAIANSVDKVWESLNKIYPDILIIDPTSDPLNIDNLLSKLQQDLKFQHIPLIFLTAKGLTEDRIKGYKYGCDVYVSKPFDPEELEFIIKNIVNKTRVSIDWMRKIYTNLQKIRMIIRIKQKASPKQRIHLTSTEKLVLSEVLKGKLNLTIAQELRTSKRHIEYYISRLLDKTSASNKKELKNFPWDNIF